MLSETLKKISLKELNILLEEAKKDKSFGGGFRFSAISRELSRRKNLKNKV